MVWKVDILRINKYIHQFYLIVLLAILLPTITFAGSKRYGSVQVEKVISNYDGDTIRVSVKGWHPLIGNNIGIRIAGIDTPELRDSRPKIKALARKAKRFTRAKLSKGNKIILKNMRRGKYFRIVAEVWIDGESLGKQLLEKGLAKKYYGGKKPKW